MTLAVVETHGIAASPWRLAFTKPLAEAVAKTHLERQGYRVYWPRVQEKVLQRGKWRDRIASLFPRYLFVQLDPTRQSLAPIRSTVGVANVVRFGVDYAVAPSVIVESLIAREDPVTRLHTLCAGTWFKPGDRVRVAVGSLSGLEGVFQCEDADERVVVLLNLLGRETRVKIDAGCIAPAA